MKESSKRDGGAPRRAFLKDSTMVWLCLLLSIIILVGGNAARILLDARGMLPDLVKSALNPVVLMGASYYFFSFSKRYSARIRRDSAQPLPDDPRPPVVYLRSFDSDEVVPGWLQLETQEEKLESVFSKIGPFVAFGKPGEEFPPLGAERKYVLGDWRKDITELISRARLVVLRAGGSDSLLWEVARATRQLRPEQLLILVPAGRKNYEAFCSRAGHYFPRPLPEYPFCKIPRTRIKGVICFEPDWTARLLTFKRTFLRGSFTNRLPRALQAALRPVYERLGLRWRPPSINWMRLILIGSLAGVLIYAFASGS